MPYSIFRLVVSALSISLSAGCASVAPISPVAESGKELPKPPAEVLPNVVLQSEVLYDILVGEIAGQRGQIEVAAVTLGKVAQKTRDPRVAERATLAALYAKRYTEALAAARLWVELRPKNMDAREALATALLELDQPAEARLQLETILAAEEGRHVEQAYLRIASALARTGNRVVAVEIMQSLVDLHPKVAAAHFAMAHLAVRGGDLEKAASAADRALAIRADWEEAALFKVRILISQKETQKARSLYKTFLSDNPGATNVRLNYARFLIEQKEWDKARDEFKRILTDLPDDADAVYAVGLLSLQTNQLDEAEKYLKMALDLRPQNDQARLYLGQVTEGGKRYAEALRWYRDVQPGEYYFEAQTRLAVILAKQKDLAGARKHLRSIQIENDPQRVQVALAEEQILREAKMYKEALAALSGAIRSVPGDKDLLYARALMAEKLDMFDVSERDLREILKKDPKNVNALNALGFTLTDRTTRYPEALDLLQQAMTLKPDDAFILDSMGWLQFRMGNNAESVKYLRRALDIRNDAEIAAHLGEVLWVMGDRKEAESVWNRALHDTPDSEALTGVIKKFKP